MARKATFDPDITKAVRNKALADILEVLKETVISKKYGVYKKQMLLKLATTVLPRVNEHSGPNGKPIPILNILDHEDNNGSSEDKETDRKD